MPSQKDTIVLLALSCFLVSYQPISVRMFDQCEAVEELISAGIQNNFVSNFICLMQSMSNFNTSKKIGPEHKASFSYGIFQISSDEWCNAWRPGGYCNKTCNDFLDNNIKDDIVRAETIWKMRGFKHLNGWVKNCKSKKLPNLARCFKVMDFEEELKEEISTFSRMLEWQFYGMNSHLLRLNFSQFVDVTKSLMYD